MRAHTLTCLSALWFSTIQGCTEDTNVADAGKDSVPRDAARDAQSDAAAPDAGPVNCDTRGTWRVTLFASSVRCGPRTDVVLTITVDDDSDAGLDAFAPTNQPSGPFCTPDARVDREVDVAAEGCTVTASSLTAWCANGEPQCSEYKLTLHVRGDSADVEGSYRHCWCGTAGPTGTTVQLTGKAIRQ
jgi:hypothetical protein